MFNDAAAYPIAMTAFGETTCGGRGGNGATLQSPSASNLICKSLFARVFYFYFTPSDETAMVSTH
jgi:hypothetical protein